MVQERNPFLRGHQGQRYRIYAAGAEVYNKLGIASVVLAGGEIVPALERGAIDGAEWINCYDDKILGMDKVAKFHYAPGIHEPATVEEFIINKAKWDALPADLKEIVKTSVQASYWNHFVRFQEKTAKACQELLASGVKIIKTTDELNKGFLQAYDEVWQADAAKDEFYRKVIESQKKYSGLVVPYRLSYWPNYNFIAEHYYKDKDLAEVSGSTRRRMRWRRRGRSQPHRPGGQGIVPPNTRVRFP